MKRLKAQIIGKDLKYFCTAQHNMIEEGTTIGYSSTTTESVSGKPFPGIDHRNNHLTSGGGAATTSSNSLTTSRMHLVDSWRESFLNNSYEKHVS